MLIPVEEFERAVRSAGVECTGVFHVGAHECEELKCYEINLGIDPTNIVWIDAMEEKVNEAKARGIPNVYHAVVSDKDDEMITFNIANSVQSSSILKLKTHLQEHPWIHTVSSIIQKSITVDSFFKRNNLDASKYTIWNFDIQGAELLALKGATESLKFAKVLYLEVNVKELYEGCAQMSEIDAFLTPYGFQRSITHMTQHGWGDAVYVKTTSS